MPNLFKGESIPISENHFSEDQRYDEFDQRVVMRVLNTRSGRKYWRFGEYPDYYAWNGVDRTGIYLTMRQVENTVLSGAWNERYGDTMSGMIEERMVDVLDGVVRYTNLRIVAYEGIVEKLVQLQSPGSEKTKFITGIRLGDSIMHKDVIFNSKH